VTDGRLLNIAGTLAVAAQLDRSEVQATGLVTPLAGTDAISMALTTGLHGKVLTKDSNPVPVVEGASLPAAWLQLAFDEDAGTPPATLSISPPQNGFGSLDVDSAWSAALEQVSTRWLESTFPVWHPSETSLQSPADSGLQSWLCSCPWLDLESPEQLQGELEEPAAG
jgi:hypothetical protein